MNVGTAMLELYRKDTYQTPHTTIVRYNHLWVN
jgi:hypothetical protein